jgi:hypothetical protein
MQGIRFCWKQNTQHLALPRREDPKFSPASKRGEITLKLYTADDSPPSETEKASGHIIGGPFTVTQLIQLGGKRLANELFPEQYVNEIPDVEERNSPKCWQ